MKRFLLVLTVLVVLVSCQTLTGGTEAVIDTPGSDQLQELLATYRLERGIPDIIQYKQYPDNSISAGFGCSKILCPDCVEYVYVMFVWVPRIGTWMLLNRHGKLLTQSAS